LRKVYPIMKPREAAITYLKELLQSEEIECLKEDSVNQGYGLKLSGEHQGGAFALVLYFNNQGLSSKLVMEKGGEALVRLLEQKLGPGTAASGNSTTAPDGNKVKDDHATTFEDGIITRLYAQPHIGTDESGKGDYFGPLVVAGVFLQPEEAGILQEMGVADSKTLSDRKIAKMAEDLRALFQERYNLVFIRPEKYNELYAKMGNLNRLLAWGHARVIENLLERIEAKKEQEKEETNYTCRYALADKFGEEGYILRALMQKGRQIRLVQIPRGERDLAVAAASILARDMFVRKMAEFSKEYGVDLPKGCSEKVKEAARQIIALHGQEALAKVAKLHFKTTQEL
jgi:ribonuclease HIII